MSTFPLVGSALRVYEQGEASSRVVKVRLPCPHFSPQCKIISFDQYGAAMVESSVKTIPRPVIDRLPVNFNQIDEFACRQLDRVRFFPFFAYLPPFVIVIVARFASAADRSHVIVLARCSLKRGDASPFPIFLGANCRYLCSGMVR